MVDQIKAGKNIEYLGLTVTGQKPQFRVPLEGFAKAIDGQPMPIEKFTEEQKRIAEVIRHRLAELRKQQEEAAKNVRLKAERRQPLRPQRSRPTKRSKAEPIIQYRWRAARQRPPASQALASAGAFFVWQRMRTLVPIARAFDPY